MLFAELPNDVLLAVGEAILALNLPAALQLRAASVHHRQLLESLKAKAEQRRLRWLPQLSSLPSTHPAFYQICNEGRTVRRVPFHRGWVWAVGSLLPTQGKSSWRVRVDQLGEISKGGSLCIGVADEAARNAWGLSIPSGQLHISQRDAEGHPVIPAEPAPKPFPNGDGAQVLEYRNHRLVDPNSFPCNGWIIEVLLDHDKGTLAFRINDDPPAEVPAETIFDENSPPFRFPKGAALRLFYKTDHYGEGQVTLVRPWV